MKKVIVLLLVCFMALGAPLAMADTRTDALGLTAGQQVDDLDSIWLFPQDAGNFGNVVDLRLNNPSYDYGSGGDYGDWAGIIHKDWDEVGYLGVYFNRPFNQTNGISPNTQWANQQGILNGWNTWSNAVNPNNSSWMGAGLNNPNGNEFPYWPSTAYNSLRMNDEVNWQFGWGMSEYDIVDPENSVDLFWARDFSDVALGVHLNYASQQGNDGANAGDGAGSYVQGTATLNNTTNSAFKAETSVIGVDLGATLKNLGSDMTLALGLGYSLGTMNYSEKYDQNSIAVGTQTPWYESSIKDNNISEIRVNALLKNKINDSTTGRIYANARLDNLGAVNNTSADDSGDGTYGDTAREVYTGTVAYTDTNINVGLACDHSVDDGKAKVIAGLGVIMDSRKWTYTALTNLAGSTTPNQVRWGSGSSYTEEAWVVPFNIAIEAPIFDWLTSRLGAQTALFNTVSAKDIYLRNANAGGTAYMDTVTLSNAVNVPQSLNLSYGVSAKFNNLTLDLQLDPDALLEAAQNLEPGSGVLYGSTNESNSSKSNVSGIGNMFSTIIQVDARYAF